jgi:DNA repair protein RecO (recombination protein O)
VAVTIAPVFVFLKWYNLPMDYKYTGIILSKMDVGETDRIYTAYTLESGKVRLLAKGVRKPNAKLAGVLEPLTAAEIFIAKSRGRGNITGAICEENFSCLKGNIMAMPKVFLALRIFDKLVSQEEKDKSVYLLLREYLQTAETNNLKKETDLILLTFGFIAKLLDELGYGIQTKACAGCGKKLNPGKNYFSAELGGIICPDCSQEQRMAMAVNDETIKLLRIISDNSLSNFKKIKVNEAIVRNLKIIVNEAVRWNMN